MILGSKVRNSTSGKDQKKKLDLTHDRRDSAQKFVSESEQMLECLQDVGDPCFVM